LSRARRQHHVLVDFAKAPLNFRPTFKYDIGSHRYDTRCALASHTHCVRQAIGSTLTQGTHTHPFNVPLSGTTWVSQYQKGKTNLDFTEARDSEWQWHQLDNMQVCTLVQTDNHASISPLKFFTCRMPFLPPNQQCQRTEGRTLTQAIS